MRNLVIVLGDQLNDDSAIFDGFERDKDAIWMAEVAKRPDRLAPSVSGMRHYEQRATQRGYCVAYRRRDDRTDTQSLETELLRSIAQYKPSGLVVVEPGDDRDRDELLAAAQQAGLPLDLRMGRKILGGE